MAKQIEAYIKLQIPAGGANPSPPVGPALGQRGVNIMEFCKAFNAKTQDLPNIDKGTPIPVVITVFNDRSFTFIMKTPPAAVMLKKLAKIAKFRRPFPSVLRHILGRTYVHSYASNQIGFLQLLL